MHRVSRRRAGGGAGAQVQVRDHGSLSARSEAREAARAHEGLGELCAGDHRRSRQQRDYVEAGITPWENSNKRSFTIARFWPHKISLSQIVSSPSLSWMDG